MRMEIVVNQDRKYLIFQPDSDADKKVLQEMHDHLHARARIILSESTCVGDLTENGISMLACYLSVFYPEPIERCE